MRWRLNKTVSMPAFTNTPHGVFAHLPIIPTKIPRLIIAVLFCASSTQKYGLLLHTCSEATSPLGPLYDTGIPTLDRQAALRLVPLDEDEDPNLAKVIDLSKGYVVAEWRDVYIRALQPPYRTIPRIPVNRSASFYIPRWLLKEFGGTLIRQGAGPAHPGPLPGTFLLYADTKHRAYPFLLQVGRCTYPSGTRWANVVRFEGGPLTVGLAQVGGGGPAHDCQVDHIRGWQDDRKAFHLSFYPPADPSWSPGMSSRHPSTKHFTVTVWFTPSPINADTRTLHLEVLAGEGPAPDRRDSASADTSGRSPRKGIVPLPSVEPRPVAQSTRTKPAQLQESEVLDPAIAELDWVLEAGH